MSLPDEGPDRQELRRLRSRRDIAELDYLRALRPAAPTGVSRALARALGTAEPALGTELERASQVDDVRPGFSGASPYEIAERFNAGEMTREQLVDELSRWPYVEGRLADDVDWTTAVPGEWNVTVGRALDDGLIDVEIYDLVLNRLESEGR